MDMEQLSLSTLALPGHLRGILSTMGPLDALDILLVAMIIYKVYKMLEDTRAITLVKGLVTLMLLTVLCSWLELHAIYWLLLKTVTLLFVALPIVFQPELRRALEHLGQGRFFANASALSDTKARKVIKALDAAAQRLSAQKTGALIVIEQRGQKLHDICESGIKIDGRVSTELLMNVFFVNTPLHDGAVVIRDNRLFAAGCLLPLTQDHSLPTELGTRHRAAIGLSEKSDALVLVVSEETGKISVARHGKLERGQDHMGLNSAELRNFLTPMLEADKREELHLKNLSLKDLIKLMGSMGSWRKKEK